MIKIIGFKKLKTGNKKYEITFNKNGKKYTRKFGSTGMSDFTKHKDKNRRERYISRHKKDLRTRDPMRPGYLSMYILCNKPTLKASLEDYKRRLNIYNRTGKFPTSITGSKKLSFGTTNIPFDDTSMNILPGDIQQSIRKNVAVSTIQGSYKNAKLVNLLKEMKKLCENPNNCKTLDELFWGLDPDAKEASNVYTIASNILTKQDLQTEFWYAFLLHLIEEFVKQDPNNDEFLDSEQIKYWKKSELAAFKMLSKINYDFVDPDDPDWYNDVYKDLKKNMNFGAPIPFEDTSMRVLTSDNQNLIRDIVSTMIIQDQAKKYDPKRSLLDALKIRAYTRYAQYGKDPRNLKFIQRLWINLDPENSFTAKWFTRAAKVLNKSDFDFKTRNFWYKIMEYNLRVMTEMSLWPYASPVEYLDEPGKTYYSDTLKATVKLLNKTGYDTTLNSTNSFNWSADALNWWITKRTN